MTDLKLITYYLKLTAYNLFSRYIKIKCSTLARFALGMYKAMMVFNDLFAYGQPYARTTVFITPVQPLKQLKYFFFIFLLKANTVVGYTNFIVILYGKIGFLFHFPGFYIYGFYINDRGLTGPGILQRITH